jgi:2-polyprenyl-3-methyl-5-hydroxy-6-metoxy-1,4-benzoquinol methylase
MTILTEYSKPSADVAADTALIIAEDERLRRRQLRIAQALHGCPRRERCLVCAGSLKEANSFVHRSVSYARCSFCGHVQSSMEPPEGYPHSMQDFADIYRRLDPDAYRDRTERVYAPKLAWLLGAAEATGLGNLLDRSWVDIGCGAGYFIDALRRSGASRVVGVEAEAALVQQANSALSATIVQHFDGTLAEAVRRHPAEVYVAWFVIEHCLELGDLFDALRECPPGTVLAFSVPTYGVAALLEGAFEKHYARNLDSVLHLHLFTDGSIARAMKETNYEIKAEWIFGQDADDLYRSIVIPLGGTHSAEAMADEKARLLGCLSDIQAVIDRARLSDARHILAVRK